MSPIIETKEIGISFEITKGTYSNVELVGGTLRLKKEGELFAQSGFWESQVIDIEGRFREYDKIAVAKQQYTKDLYRIETRSSDDGISFNEYISITAGGHILSPKKRYIQIKISFYAGMINDIITLAEFDNPEEVENWEDATYIKTDDGLELKTEYEYTMSEDTSWSDEGSLHRHRVEIDKFKRINSLSIE